MVYSFRLAARVLLYASSHIQDNTYHDLCYTSRGSLAGTRNSYYSGHIFVVYNVYYIFIQNANTIIILLFPDQSTNNAELK